MNLSFIFIFIVNFVVISRDSRSILVRLRFETASYPTRCNYIFKNAFYVNKLPRPPIDDIFQRVEAATIETNLAVEIT